MTELRIQSLIASEKASDQLELDGGGRLMVRARQTRHALVREFFFRYRTRDSDKLLRIGQHGDGKKQTLTLKQARVKAAELSTLLKQGKDPQVNRLIERDENRRAEQQKLEAIELEARKGTLKDLVTSYVAHLKAQGKMSARDTDRTLERHVLEPFPHLAARKAQDITAADITDILARMIAKGIERRTNIVRSMLRAAFAYGAGLDNDPVRKAAALKGVTSEAVKLFGISGNPVADIRRIGHYDRAGERTLDDSELRAYIEGLGPLHPGIAGTLHTALLLGGQRMSQLIRAKWPDYDDEERILSLRDAKGRGGIREHRLPVSDRVAAILESLRGLNGEGTYIFSTRAGSTPVNLSTLSSAVGEIAKRVSNSSPFSAADIRRTAETRLAALGVSKEHRAQLLSHGRTQGVQERHYDRHDYLSEKTAALAKWELHLDVVLSGKPTNVVRARFRA
ncbi:MAG: integrase arm-type DNA-binding domain-containing protein [Anaerolineae bacterium]|nr:integrase arm-type DNA-binding domain-containing protein [Anaerolineae bacterium]